MLYFEVVDEQMFVYLSVPRYGKPGCDAETCDYFLSYRRIGTDVEYEMSADTDGWVAVGFSSDKKMVRLIFVCLIQAFTVYTSYLKLLWDPEINTSCHKMIIIN